MNPSGMIPIKQENSNISLYDHQVEAIEELNNWKDLPPSEHQNPQKLAGLLVLPTGGGKTLTATYWLMKNILIEGKKVLWIAHRYSLLDQAYHSFGMVSYQNISGIGKKYYRYRIVSGVHSNGYSISPDDDILIAMVAGLKVTKEPFRKWLEKNRDNFYFIIDEAHHAGAKGYRKLIDDMREYGGKFFMLGLTATPFRSDEEDFGGWLKKVFPDDILYRTSISNLVEKGILSKPIFERPKTNIDMRKIFKEKNAEYIYNRLISDKKFDIDSAGKDGKLAAKIIAENHKRNQLIVATYINNASRYGKTLVFALNQAMAKLLYKYFQEAGVKTGCVINDFGSYENEQTIKRFKNNELDVLVNVNIVTEGVDVPNIETVFLTRPTKSKTLMTQMIGRGLRGQKVGGTEKTYIVDFLDYWEKGLFAWVVPEKLYDVEAIDPTIISLNATDEKKLSELEILNAISEGQLAEFIQQANSVLSLSLFEKFSFIERVPIGYYCFDYDAKGDDGEFESKSCTVLVPESLKSKFEDIMDWLKNHKAEDIFDTEAKADEIDRKYFGKREKLLGYKKDTIADILNFYVQNEGKELPDFVEFADRNDYDVANLAQHIVNANLKRNEERNYIQEEWDKPDGKWKKLFGEGNEFAFYNAINAELARIDGSLKKSDDTLTVEELKTAESLPLDNMVVSEPLIYEKIRDAVYEKSHDANGYFDSQNNRSKNRLDFDIEYKTPLSAGGKTEPDNLQLVYRTPSKNIAWENMPLNAIKSQDPTRYKEICDSVYRNHQRAIDGKYFDGKDASKVSADEYNFEIDYRVPLSAGGKTELDNLYLKYNPNLPVIIPSTSTPATTTTPPPVISLDAVARMFDNLKNLPPNDGSQRLAIKNQILDTLSKLEEKAIQDCDAETMRQIGIYYGKLFEHRKADICFRQAEYWAKK